MMPDSSHHPLRSLVRDRRNPRVWIISTALLIVLAAGGLVMRHIATRPSPIHIAFGSSLSGAVASQGAESLTAAQLYVDERSKMVFNLPVDAGGDELSVSAASNGLVAGDYYQAMFAAEEDTDDPDSPYLLLRRQFEMPDGDECYIETHDKDYTGHFRLRRIEFTPERLLIEIDRPADNLIGVTFAVTASDFRKTSRVIKIIHPSKSIGWQCDDP
jgi:hypothetical protein